MLLTWVPSVLPDIFSTNSWLFKDFSMAISQNYWPAYWHNHMPEYTVVSILKNAESACQIPWLVHDHSDLHDFSMTATTLLPINPPPCTNQTFPIWSLILRITFSGSMLLVVGSSKSPLWYKMSIMKKVYYTVLNSPHSQPSQKSCEKEGNLPTSGETYPCFSLNQNDWYQNNIKKCNLTLKRAHLPVTWLIDFTPELQLAIAIMLLPSFQSVFGLGLFHLR